MSAAKQYNVIRKRDGYLVEGGFFTRFAAEKCAEQHTLETGEPHVVKVRS